MIPKNKYEKIEDELSKLASNIVGRDICVAVLSSKNSLAYTDGKYDIVIAKRLTRNRDKMMATLLHEIGHILDQENDDDYPEGKWGELYMEITAWQHAIYINMEEELVPNKILHDVREESLNSYLDILIKKYNKEKNK